MTLELPERQDIDDRYKWNLNDMYESLDDWEKNYKEINKLLNEFSKFENNLIDSANNLYNGLELYMKIRQKNSRLFTYAHLIQDQNTRNQGFQELYIRAQNINNEIEDKTSFIKPQIIKLKKDQLNKYFEKKPDLKKYEKFLDDILRREDHFLSRNEEKLLGLSKNLTDSFENIFGMLNNADLTFPLIEDEEDNKVRLTHSRFLKFMENKNRKVRKEAFEGLYKKYDEFKNTFASTLNANIKSDFFVARARKYDSSLRSSLDPDNIPPKVYLNLIKTIKNNLSPLHNYISIRKNILNLDTLHMYDIYVPLVDKKINISYKEAQNIILEALRPLGNKYIEIIKEAFNSRWIDVYENKGKRSGAYSSGCYEVHPYILLNYNENINSLFTLAYELGHAVHSYLSNREQPFVYSEYKIFLAEIASTLNECLLVNYLINNTVNNIEKKLYINHFLDAFRGTVYRQTKFAEFEKIIHEKVENEVPLTAKRLNEIYYNLTKKYYGKNINVDNEIKYEWARIPHFYYNFYVFQYATGFSAAIAISKKFFDEKKDIKENYLKFLKSGDSDYPLNILRKIGVDMTTPQPIKSALKLFENYLDQFHRLEKE
ncbi:MAG: oligoendopeptidase F [Bacillota bacterium]